MFQEVKAALPVSGDAYDAEIILQIKAAALDLTRTAEIKLPGEIIISREADEWDEETQEPVHWTITDDSTVTDEYIITVIATWCAARIGNPPNYDKLLEAYESMKGSMRMSKHYSTYDGEDGTDGDSEQL